MALKESKEDFERDRFMLHEMGVSAGSGRALGFEFNVEQLRTRPTVERFGIRKGLRYFLKRRRVAGRELEAGPSDFLLRPSQTGAPLALPLSTASLADLTINENLLWPVPAPS